MKARLPAGFGKQNINQLMRQAQKVQEIMKEKQAGFEATNYDVTSGGGMVQLTMNGKHEVVSIKINPDVVQPDDIEMLEDLVAAAVNEAVRVVDEASENEMNAITGGLNIPGL